jgi:hypothetical protein
MDVAVPVKGVNGRWFLSKAIYSDLKDLFFSLTIFPHDSLIASAMRRFQEGRAKPSWFNYHRRRVTLGYARVRSVSPRSELECMR